MKLFTTITSERGKPITKSGNEFILMDLTVNRQVIGQVELYYYNDTETDKKMTDDEWVLKFRTGDSEDDNDWDIIAQGNNSKPKTGNIKCGCGRMFYGVEDKEDTCPQCLKKIMTA